MVATEFGVTPNYRVLTKPMLRLAGWFNPTVRESYEMLYQSEYDYLVDSKKFENAFSFEPMSYSQGVRITSAALKK
jgi:hypothetical protein